MDRLAVCRINIIRAIMLVMFSLLWGVSLAQTPTTGSAPTDADVLSFPPYTGTTAGGIGYTVTLLGTTTEESYGAGPHDPTIWFNAAGEGVTITFDQPVDNPNLLLWGMNNDDFGRIEVNGTSYALNDTVDLLSPELVWGSNSIPDSNLIVNSTGQITDVTSTSLYNYAAQRLTLGGATAVTSVSVYYVAGAGWGFVGFDTTMLSVPMDTELTITKVASVDPVTSGTPFDYVITVTDVGDSIDADNVVISDTLDGSLTCNSVVASDGGVASSCGSTVTCTWASIPDGLSRTCTISVTP